VFYSLLGMFIKSQDASQSLLLMVKRMKKTASSRNKKTRNTSNRAFDANSVRILRTVKDPEAFYFYEAIGKPTGEVARNLHDFAEKVKSVRSESLLFHSQRSDFPNWIEKILGDSKLAEQLRQISPSNSADVRTTICRTVENRIDELKQAAPTILVDQNTAILLSSS